MNSKQIYHDPVTYALIFDKGDEFLNGMVQFAKQEGLSASYEPFAGASHVANNLTIPSTLP